jgi:TolB protein
MKETLERIRRQVRSGPDGFERLSRLRRRRQQRRRLASGVVALAVAAVGVWGLSRAFSTVGPPNKAIQQPAPPLPDRKILFRGVYAVNPDGTDVHLIHPGVEPAYSPDGSKIVFAKTFAPGRECFTCDAGLFVMNVDGRHARRLTEGKDTSPDWSPNGKRIAFQRTIGGTTQIWVIDTDGTGLRRITHLQRGGWFPSWSPDSSQVMFADGVGSLYVINADGSRLTPIDADTTLGIVGPRWSPDGSRVVFTASSNGWGVYTMNADGTHVRRLTNFDTGCAGGASWSPDGSWIVFSTGCDHWSKAALYIMTADGGHLRRILERPHGIGPSW